jgi:hypothetical protein
VIRSILAVLVAIYLLVGLWFGACLRVTMPAVSLAGGAYVAATWPAWLRGSPIKLPIPRWAFHFEDD